MDDKKLPTENDERLKKRLIVKSRYGYAIISAYDADVTHKKRHNSKKARELEKLIIEAEFEYKRVSTNLPNNETKTDFIVFDKFDDGFNETGIRLDEFLENVRKINWYKDLSVQHDIEVYLRDKTFFHPLLKSTKEKYLERRELFLEDLFEPPEWIGEWSVASVSSETSVLYEKDGILCSISRMSDGKWQRAYGTIRPVGALIKNEVVDSREEAFSNLKLPYKRHSSEKPQD